MNEKVSKIFYRKAAELQQYINAGRIPNNIKYQLAIRNIRDYNDGIAILDNIFSKYNINEERR